MRKIKTKFARKPQKEVGVSTTRILEVKKGITALENLNTIIKVLFTSHPYGQVSCTDISEIAPSITRMVLNDQFLSEILQIDDKAVCKIFLNLFDALEELHIPIKKVFPRIEKVFPQMSQNMQEMKSFTKQTMLEQCQLYLGGE